MKGPEHSGAFGVVHSWQQLQQSVNVILTPLMMTQVPDSPLDYVIALEKQQGNHAPFRPL